MFVKIKVTEFPKMIDVWYMQLYRCSKTNINYTHIGMYNLHIFFFAQFYNLIYS